VFSHDFFNHTSYNRALKDGQNTATATMSF